jgi:hypothetical protein
MKKQKMKKMKGDKSCGNMHCGGSGGCFYFLGFLGALIYFLQTSTGFWNSVLAILKALVWPVFVVLKILGM